MYFETLLSNKKVLVTGHTGFTGSWACLWLNLIGAKVIGYALAPETTPSLYSDLDLDSTVNSVLADIRDYQKLTDVVSQFQPDAILHLAAQPLVRRSYYDPVLTFTTNAIGTNHVLEVARHIPTIKAVLCVTTDKVYQNGPLLRPYRETDPLGGLDPYSASKVAAEIIIESYKASFSRQDKSPLAIATARGGNIIGGGDWSEDRLIPDFVRAVYAGASLTLRYPEATRPWQHVLSLVQGYLMILAGLLTNPTYFARPWNLGPKDPKNYSVRQIVEILSQTWAAPDIEYMENPLKETHYLTLDSSLAHKNLGWSPVWDTHKSITETGAWYNAYFQNPDNVQAFTQSQLNLWRQNQENTLASEQIFNTGISC